MKEVKVVIVDDSAFQRSLLEGTLKGKNFNVVGMASSLEEAVKVIKEVRPDVVTMDITMPGADGFECAEAIRKVDENIKIIMVSAMKDDELIEKSKEINAVGFLQKPVDEEELELLINRVMSEDESFEELKQIYQIVFKEAVTDVFNRFTKTVPKFIGESDGNKTIRSEGIAIVMGITGKYSGRVVFDMSEKSAANLAKFMLKRDPANKEELYSAMAEMANVIAGNACSMINKKNKIFGLRVAPPTTLYGQALDISKTELSDDYLIKFDTIFGDFLINVGFGKGNGNW